MKKTKMLTAAVIAAMVSLGAGYAAWTDNLTITSNVTTGKLNVQMADGSVIVNSGSEANPDTFTNSRTHLAIATSDKKGENVTITNLYPGAVATVSIPVHNAGSIGAKLDNNSLKAAGAPEWLQVSTTDTPADLAVGADGTITLTCTVVDKKADGTAITVPQDTPANFTVSPVYGQFNK